MTYFSDHVPNTPAWFTFILIICSCFGTVSLAAELETTNYELSLSFVPQEGRLVGTSKITIKAGRKLTLSFQGLEITGTLLQDENGRKLKLLPTQNALSIPSTKANRTLFLSYTKIIREDFDNLISPSGISLTSNWYPQPEQPMLFHVTAILPDNFSAITEADVFPLKQQGNTVSATFSIPVTNIHFAAGPYSVEKQKVREGLFVYSMFFKEDQELAGGYLQAAVAYINRYEKEIGPYPYNHYVIVANRLPTGYGMPTFTLLGQTVLRLPFIKETSLGHEIVHSWFGNAVEVNSSQGNWCEGLTSFLADHAYRKEKGEGVADRLESITRYLSYVHKDSAIPLADFRSASHNQPLAEAKRAVGYERGSLLFQELREKIGFKHFEDGLRRFYIENYGKQTTWDDLKLSFEAASGANLGAFFSERLLRNYIPELSVEDIKIEYPADQTILSFKLLQKSEKPFSLVVPIRIKTMSSTINLTTDITERTTRILAPVDQVPLEFTIDPDHTFLRKLTDQELPPVWSQFLGAEKKLVVLGKESDRDLYQPLLDSLGEIKLLFTTAAKVTNLELSQNNLLFLGIDQAPSRALFGPPNDLKMGFRLDVRRNPLNKSYVAVLISSSGRDQTMSISRQISHYGKYSYLEFQNGRSVTKSIQPTTSGLHFVLEKLPTGDTTSTLTPFEKLMQKLANTQVVYVGETHTSLSDHLLQLRIIEDLYRKNHHLAIGMEMFPTSSQPALDRYTLSGKDIDERTFLKESDYYNVWQFDYRLFRETLRFARKNHIPVIGLNLDHNIVAEVFRSGGTDSLDKEVQQSLPKDRDLDMEGYSERLSLMHDMHIQGKHGIGSESGFIQAQALWDETMAKNIASFMVKHPDYRMVVLAGSQHTRKDSGIPPRVARRLPVVQQASVLNIYDDNAPANLNRVADYFFVSAPAELPESPKIGVVLTTETENNQTFQKISQLNPHGKAASAGLLVGDILREVNGYPISDMADLKIAMFDTKEGEIINIKVVRKKDSENRELLFKVELTIPPATQPHP
jgi:aminopeptidase N